MAAVLSGAEVTHLPGRFGDVPFGTAGAQRGEAMLSVETDRAAEDARSHEFASLAAWQQRFKVPLAGGLKLDRDPAEAGEGCLDAICRGALAMYGIRGGLPFFGGGQSDLSAPYFGDLDAIAVAGRESESADAEPRFDEVAWLCQGARGLHPREDRDPGHQQSTNRPV